MSTALPVWTLATGFIAVFVLTVAAVGLARRLLLRWDILDSPHKTQSSHTTPTPVGGGAGVLAVALPVWLALMVGGPHAGALPWAWTVPLWALALAAISAVDDWRGIPPLPRFAAQAVAVTFGLAALPEPVFQGLLPQPLDRIVAGIAWLWFVNLFNFMDGIDGITGVETITIGGGVFLVVVIAGIAPALGTLGLLLCAGALAFLYWNWHPARVFLGDVGSVSMGYLMGWLLLSLAAEGAWAAAVILPLVYLADATLTLLRRAARGEPVWRAHREYFYQKAVLRGLGHDAVALRVAAVNAVLTSLALASLITAPWAPWAALAGAAAVTAALLLNLHGIPAPDARDST